MRGSIVKRGKTWSYVVYLGRDQAGTKRQKWVGGFRTRRDAENALNEALNRVRVGTWADPGRQTLGDYLDTWLIAVKPGLANSTWASYSNVLSAWVVPRLGRTRLAALTAADLNRVYAELLKDGGRTGRPLSNRSVRYAHTIVGRALADAVEWGLLPRNPARSAKPPKERTKEMTVWTAQEVHRFLDAMRGDRLYALWALLLTTGLRRAEVAGLRWSDVDLEAARIAVQHTRVTVEYKVQESEPKTARSRRSVALDLPTVDLLRRHREAQLEERLVAGPLWQESKLVFVREDGVGYHPQRITQMFQRLAGEAGVPVIRLHDLRHTAATVALAAGVHPKVVQERLGHTSIGITLDTYSHVVEGMQDDAAARVGSIIFGGAQTFGRD